MRSKKQNCSIAKIHPHVVTTTTYEESSAAADKAPPAMMGAAGGSGSVGSEGTVTGASAAHHPFVRRYQDELAHRRSEYARSGQSSDRLPPIAETLNALALVHHHMIRNPAEALRYHEEALGILEECIAMGQAQVEPLDGESNEDGSECACTNSDLLALRFHAAVTLSDVGDVQYTLGMYREASASYAEALNRYRRASIDDGHPRVLSTRNRLERLRWRGDAGDGDQATTERGESQMEEARRQAAFVAKGA